MWLSAITKREMFNAIDSHMNSVIRMYKSNCIDKDEYDSFMSYQSYLRSLINNAKTVNTLRHYMATEVDTYGCIFNRDLLRSVNRTMENCINDEKIAIVCFVFAIIWCFTVGGC